ncbi:alpha/beta hydrolase [Nocardia sp. CWNU-33]|uniref:alpha/beta hydrolase n=1 Tax=Nocardia sp. CWNU-33 TaxID=3392117 RepID=UPI00398E8D25
MWEAAVHGEWVQGPKATRTDAVVFYIHGGGFFAGSPRTHRGVTSRLSTATRLLVFSVSYRLAPEHRFPAAPDDVANGYRWLIDQGYAPDRIVIAGDSAGGFLAMDLVIENARIDAPQPAAVVLISPMNDLSFATAQAHERTRRDAFVSVARAAPSSIYTPTVLPIRAWNCVRRVD